MRSIEDRGAEVEERDEDSEMNGRGDAIPTQSLLPPFPTFSSITLEPDHSRAEEIRSSHVDAEQLKHYHNGVAWSHVASDIN